MNPSRQNKQAVLSRDTASANERNDAPLLAPPPPAITLRGIVLSAGGWLLYSLLGTIPLQSYVGIPFLWAIVGQLAQNLSMALLSIPVWLIVIRAMDSSRWRWKVCIHLVTAPIYAYLSYEIYFLLTRMFGGEEAAREVARVSEWILYYNSIVYLALFAIYHGVQTMKRLRFKEQQALELLALNRERELATLKSQINPHFLFNTLNSISAMASADPEETRTMIARLGDLLRSAIEGTKHDFVLLRDEVDFIRSYLELESNRLGDRLRVQYNIPAESLQYSVPPMILQPLVENAIRHGIEPGEEGGTVMITILTGNGKLHMSVRDTGAGLQRAQLPQQGGGIGIKNTDTRLRAIFGEGSGVSTNLPEEGGFEAGFSIPLQVQESR